MSAKDRALLDRYRDEERVFAAHLLDLIGDVREGKGCRYTGFCDIRSKVITDEVALHEGVSVSFYGGYEDSERVIAALFEAKEMPERYPISAIFLDTYEEITHRDVLGSVIALGVKREYIGDIVRIGGGQVIFVKPPADRLILDELVRIGRSAVKCNLLPEDKAIVPIRQYKEIKGTVASLRLDSIVALCCSVSRSEAQKLVSSGKAQVNSINISDVAYVADDHCTVSVRGFGKYIFSFGGKVTSKGRYSVNIKKII